MLYFIGAGGIGMSALARYFRQQGKLVAGYDLTPTKLTESLIGEGIEISFADDVSTIPRVFLEENSRKLALVVYTPAVPASNRIFQFFTSNGYNVVKRSRVLGDIFNDATGIAVAGTHGKTSVSTLTAHLLRQSSAGCNAFLGGISKNYNTNLLLSGSSGLMVVEADEFDRSFLQLLPDIAVITSMDPDHLDVYGNFSEMKKAFSSFAGQVKQGGTIFIKRGLDLGDGMNDNVALFTYGLDSRADYHAVNISLVDPGLPVFDLVTPENVYRGLRLGVPGRFNVENAVAAAAVSVMCGLNEQELRSGLESFMGISRRFEVLINSPRAVLIDDYAHHPEEIRASVSSVREIFPGRHLTGIFQPHLYSRTYDLAAEFAESLEALDQLILLDIYPAREEPIPGVSSEMILNKVRMENKLLCRREEVPAIITGMPTDVVIAMGAGNIDAMAGPLKKILSDKIKDRQ